VTVIGSVPAVVAAAVAGRVAHRTGVSDGTTAALVGGLVVAVDGLLLHRLVAADEQTVGLVLVPLAVVTLARLIETGRLRWVVVTGTLVLAVPPTHNLDSVVLGLAGVIWLAATPRRETAALAVTSWIALGGYTLGVRWLTPSVVVQTERLTSVVGLLFAWVIAAVAVVRWVRSWRPRARGVAVGGILAVPFGLVAVNAAKPVFPGTPTTTPLLVGTLGLLVVPSMAAAVGTTLRRGGAVVTGLVALSGAVAVVVGVSLTAGLTPVYLETAYRVQTFAHLPWGVAV
ncbi:MAG: hypothetical protein ABEI99_06480, partial [Halobaculum sp.]